jgi:hypothetical protein
MQNEFVTFALATLGFAVLGEAHVRLMHLRIRLAPMRASFDPSDTVTRPTATKRRWQGYSPTRQSVWRGSALPTAPVGRTS